MKYELPVRRILPVFRLDPWARTLRDNAGNTAPSIAGSGLQWRKWVNQYGLQATSTGRLVAANSTALEAITDFSLFWCGNLDTTGLTRTILDKQDGGGIQLKVGYDFSGGDRIFLDDGSNVRTIAVSLNSITSACLTLTSGGTAQLYLNGALAGSLSGVSTITGDDADITLLNAYDGSEPYQDGVDGLFLYGGVLTAAEVAILHSYSRERVSARIQASRLSFHRDNGVPKNDPNDAGSWDLGTITNDEVADRSGRGNHGTVVGGIGTQHTSLGTGMYFQNNGNVNVNVAASDISPTSGYVEAVFKAQDKATNQYIWSSSSNIRDRLFVGGNQLQYMRGNPAVTITEPVSVNQWIHAVGVYDSGDMELYLNGESVGTDTFLDGTQATTASIGDFINGGSLRVDNAVVLYVRRGNAPLDAIEVKRRWLRVAQTTTFYEDMTTALPTISDLSGQGLQIPGTDYVIESGTWKIVEDGINKWIECVSSGLLCRPNFEVAGTWEWEWEKTSGSAQPYFSFAQDRAATDFQGLGYQFVVSSAEGLFLRRTNAGSATVIANTANGFVALNTRYKTRVTNSNGDWRWWIKGGAYTDWTELPTGSDGTRTISALACYDFDAGDRVYLDYQYHGSFEP